MKQSLDFNTIDLPSQVSQSNTEVSQVHVNTRKSTQQVQYFHEKEMLDNWRPPVMYIVLQCLLAIPILVNSISEQISPVGCFMFVIATILAIILFFCVACTNPGYIMGSAEDVENRAGAYDPKHYQVESGRKVKDIEADQLRQMNQNQAHNRKISFLTQKLTTKGLKDNVRSHFELPPLTSDGSIPPNNQLMTTQGYDDTEKAPPNYNSNMSASGYELNLSEANYSTNQYMTAGSQVHKRIKSVLDTVDEQPNDNTLDRERQEAFKKVQEMVSAVAPKELDSNPFGESEPEPKLKVELEPPKLKPTVEITEVEEPTAASTMAAGKTDGDYSNLRQTSTNAQMEVIEEDQDAEDNGADILSFIELKYCTVCHIEMQIRTKHCKDCDMCVATHDHHCPWVGNCIGERNHTYFYVYLWVQLLQTLYGLSLTIDICTKLDIGQTVDIADGVGVILLGIACLVFSGFLSVLVGFHSYLACHALTSWEYLRWMKITYLKVWPKKYGSPFSARSKLENFKANLRQNRTKTARQWRMPARLPTL